MILTSFSLTLKGQHVDKKKPAVKAGFLTYAVS